MENKLEGILAHIQEARGILLQDLGTSSRELSIVRTKLDESEMWITREMRKLQVVSVQ